MTDISINTHSSIRIAGSRILYVDPFQITKVTHDADFILITHPHFDHFSPEDIRKVMKPDTRFVAPRSMEAEFLKCPLGPVTFMQPGDTVQMKPIVIEAMPAYNTNKPMHPRANGWLGYIIALDEIRIYVAGDTDFIPEGAHVKCDVAMVPVGGTYTMTAEEAAHYVNSFLPRLAIPTHYANLVGTQDDARIFGEHLDPRVGLATLIS